jgi:hypothetical protein
VDASNFVQTLATPLGAGHHWGAVAPVLIAALAAAGLATAATGSAPGVRFQTGRGALAVVVWAALAATVPWVLGDQSVVGGDGGAARLIAIFAVAGLVTVGLTALLRARLSARRDPVDDHRSTALPAEA